MKGITAKERLTFLFEEKFIVKPVVKKLSGGGSSREYFRLMYENFSVIGVAGNDIKENITFIKLSECLEENGINVPRIISFSLNYDCYLLEDLGDISLFQLLGSNQKMNLSETALRNLIKLQTLPENIWIDKVGYPPFSKRLVRWDLNYFKYGFLKPADVPFDEDKLEDDFDKLTESLSGSEMYNGFMYRDFQSRNIMWNDNKLWFIDFQGARKGPLAYDAVSFIWQAKAPFSYEEREELENFYISELTDLGYKPEEISGQLQLMQLLRTLQVLGAYGFRGLVERKPHFLESIPFAINNLKYLREKGSLKDYPEIERIAVILERRVWGPVIEPEGNLKLRIYSFSYKRGYPEDKTGNGGGFMFDCRAIHNPGRFDEYKALTGRDKEVIEFIESNGEAEEFVKNAVKIVSPSIERYIQRGFTSLQVGFGCTGGRHRSVYCAEKFAKIIEGEYPKIKIELIHLEKENW